LEKVVVVVPPGSLNFLLFAGVLVGLQKHFQNVKGTILDLNEKIIEEGPKVLTIPEFTNPTNEWVFKTQGVNSSNYVDVLTELTSVSPLLLLVLSKFF
jgi:hypothetical protein